MNDEAQGTLRSFNGVYLHGDNELVYESHPATNNKDQDSKTLRWYELLTGKKR
jgi:hypothetical protein